MQVITPSGCTQLAPPRGLSLTPERDVLESHHIVKVAEWDCDVAETVSALACHPGEVFIAHIHRDHDPFARAQNAGSFRGVLWAANNFIFQDGYPSLANKARGPCLYTGGTGNLLTMSWGEKRAGWEILEGPSAVCKAECLLFVRSFQIK